MLRTAAGLAVALALTSVAAAQEPGDIDGGADNPAVARRVPGDETADPFAGFIESFIKHPFRIGGQGTFDENTTFGFMMNSLTTTGYLRARYESSEIGFVPSIFGPTPDIARGVPGPAGHGIQFFGDDAQDWVAIKALLGLNFTLTPDITIFGEIIAMDVLGQDTRFNRLPNGIAVVDPQDINPEIHLYQGYASWANFLAVKGVTIKGGRTELCYGKGWLVSNQPFYGGLSWDGALISVDTGGYSVDFFGGKLASFYAPTGPTRPQLYGVYSTYTLDANLERGKETNLDLYVLYNTDDMNSSDLGIKTDFARERRATFGTKLDGWFLPTIDYSLDAAYQYGRTATLSTQRATVSAYALQGEVGNTWDTLMWTPRASLGAAYATGDSNPAGSGSSLFNPIYRDLHGWNGLSDAFKFTNLVDYYIKGTIRPITLVDFGVQGHVFKLARDRVLGLPGSSDQLGKELDVYAEGNLTRNFSFSAAYVLLHQGQRFREATGTREHNTRWYVNLVYVF